MSQITQQEGKPKTHAELMERIEAYAVKEWEDFNLNRRDESQHYTTVIKNGAQFAIPLAINIVLEKLEGISLPAKNRLEDELKKEGLL